MKKRKGKVVILIVSIMLFCMQNIVEAKYAFFYEKEIAKVWIDKISPTIKGAEELGRYNDDITITYYDNIEILSAVYYYNSETTDFDEVKARPFESGQIFTKEGYYKIVVEDTSHNITTIHNFLIDKTSPEIIGVENGVIYDLPPNIKYYDKYGIEKIEITTEEEVTLNYQYKNSNNRPCSDRTSSTLTVHICYSPKNVTEYRWYIKKEIDRNYQLIDTNLEKDFTFTNLEPDTRYNIYTVACTSDNNTYMSNLIVAQTLTENIKVEIIDVWDTGYQIKVTGIADKYKYIYFPTWTEINGQDDLIWYQYELEDSKFTFTFEYQNHNKEKGKYHTHIYLDELYVQSTYVYIGKEEPEVMKSDFIGKVEIIATDTVGNQASTEFYVDATVEVTIEKIVYDEMKRLLSNVIESYDDSNHIIKMKQSEIDKITKLNLKNCIYHEEGLTYLLGKGLSYFRKLEYLDISGSSQFSTEDLSTLTNLKYLDMSNCDSNYVYDLAFLNQLTNLEYLKTTGTNIINEQYIQNLSNLKEWEN